MPCTNQHLLIGSYAGLALMPLLASIVEVSVYVHMICSTLFTLLIGSILSLKAQNIIGHELNGTNTENMQKQENNTEYMTTRDAWMFPVIGSVVLFSLYLVFKFFPADMVNVLIKGYFYCVGTFALTASLINFLEAVLPRDFYQTVDGVFAYKLPIPHFIYTNFIAAAPADPKTSVDESLAITSLNVLCFLVSIVCGAFYLANGSWILSNLFGIAFSLQGISLISIGSTMNGLIMLWGLLIYDVFWVFGTDVMVTVAKKFDAPIKLLFPRGVGQRHSMLGLGDIVVPGIFIALMLRLDYFLQKDSKKPVQKIYFWSVIFGYLLGLSITVFVMYYFEAAQPALLYLVPTCSGSVFFTALSRGELSAWFNYTESKPEDKKDNASEIAQSGSTDKKNE